jgi:hypothetical protein
MVMLFAVLALLAFAAQFFIDFTSDNIAASCLVLASSLAVLLYILWTEAVQTHPLSTFAIFGFCFTSQMGALLAQSGSGLSLTDNLRQPLETFAWLALFQLVAMLAHALYRTFSRPQDREASSIVRAALEHLGLYQAPTAGTLWLIGLIGLCGQLISGGGGVMGKVGLGMSLFAWTPFLLPMFVAEVGAGYCNARRHYTALFGYAVFIAMLGIAANMRGMMLSGLMTIALVSVLRAMRSTQPVRAAQIGKYAALLLVVAAMAIPMSDLAVAMTIARKSRGIASPMKMMEDTFYYVTQPEQLKMQRDTGQTASRFSSYDENYFGNPLLARLMETKFHDNAMYFASRLAAKDEDKLWEVTGDFLWAALPDPALKALKIDVDKDSQRYSMGDYLSYLGGAGDLGGFKTGSGFAQGLAMFGNFFPLIYFFICLVLFAALDLLSYRSAQGGMLVSALGMLAIWKMFQYGITTESVQGFFIMVVRGVPQNILIYLLCFHIARGGANMLASLFGAGHRRAPQALAGG